MPEPLAEATLDNEQRRLLAAIVDGPRGSFLADERSPDGWALPGPFGPMLLAPGVGDPLQALGAALRYAGRLDDATRELAIVATAAACGSRYELDHHFPLARAAGVPDSVLDAVVDGTEAELLGEIGDVGAAVVQACRELVATGRVEPGRVSTLEAGLGRAEAFELLVLAGYYRLLAAVIAAYGTG